MSGTICSVIYANSDANLTVPGNEPDPREKLITPMEPFTTGVTEDRIAALEKKVRDMDALVRGLVDELARLQGYRDEDVPAGRGAQPSGTCKGPVMSGSASPVPAGPSSSFPPAVSAEGSTVIRPRGTRQPDLPVAQAEPEMVRIMQN